MWAYCCGGEEAGTGWQRVQDDTSSNLLASSVRGREGGAGGK